MKNINRITVAAILSLVIVAPLLSGCGGAAAQSSEQLVVTSGAAAGTYAVLKNNPQYAPDFTAGATVLSQVAGSTNTISAATLQPVLTQLSQTNAEVGAVVESAVTVLDTYIANFETDTNAAAVDFRTGCGWIGTGILEGVALSGQ